MDRIEAHESGLTSEAGEAIRSVFRRYPTIRKVILYGSRAMGTFRPASDIDLTIEGDGVDFGQLFSIGNELDDLLLPRKIDLPLRRHINNDDLQAHIDRVGIPFFVGEHWAFYFPTALGVKGRRSHGFRVKYFEAFEL